MASRYAGVLCLSHSFCILYVFRLANVTEIVVISMIQKPKMGTSVAMKEYWNSCRSLDSIWTWELDINKS